MVLAFRLGSELGFHVEDLIRIPRALSSLDFLFEQISREGFQGRPLHAIGIYFFSFVGNLLAGMAGIFF